MTARAPVPRTVGALVREGARRFRAAGLAFGHGTLNAVDEAAYLALHALQLAPDAGAVAFARPVSAAEARRVRRLYDRRIRTRQPAAYLTGEAWLGPYRFHVDRRVIVPRSHIAGLILQGLQPWIARPQAVRQALDLCTGSGCLAILLAHVFPGAHVDAADVSRAALAVARRNVRAHRLGKRVRALRSDLFSALHEARYDLIVCNPPYVTAKAMRRLPREYRHEPRVALAGGGDGLDVVRRVVEQARARLNPGGVLILEVGDGRRRVERAFPRVPFTWVETPGGGDVLVAARDDLPSRALPSRARRAARPLRAGAARRTDRA